MTGAQFEIRIDGMPRTYRDTKSGAMDAVWRKETTPVKRAERKVAS
jgi:hypothetical protein